MIKLAKTTILVIYIYISKKILVYLTKQTLYGEREREPEVQLKWEDNLDLWTPREMRILSLRPVLHSHRLLGLQNYHLYLLSSSLTHSLSLSLSLSLSPSFSLSLSSMKKTSLLSFFQFQSLFIFLRTIFFPHHYILCTRSPWYTKTWTRSIHPPLYDNNYKLFLCL